MRHSKYSKGGTLDEITDNREREHTEPTLSRKTGHQVREGVAIPQSKPWHIIAHVWKNFRDGNEEEPEKKEVQWQAQSGIHFKGRSQGQTLLLRLMSADRKRPIMTVLQKFQRAAESVRCRYLHITNGQKLDHQSGSIHQLIWALQQIYSRGFLCLDSVREDASNPRDWRPQGV